MTTLWRRLFRFLFRGTLLLLLAAAAAMVAIRLASAPRADGTATVRGLRAQVSITRDRHYLPHIIASSERDAILALGYVHAQDRIWQMELARRAASGTLAAILGRRALSRDRLFRILGLRRLAAQDLPGLLPETRALLEAYADGVNAWLESRHPLRLPLEFLLLRVTPEPWSAVDSLAILKLQAWLLGGNYRHEKRRLDLARYLSPAELDLFYPPQDGWPQVPAPSSLAARLPETDFPWRFPRDQTPGSNNWVVSGERSATGAPLLANDPHLELGAPVIWYPVHWETPEELAYGATIPGIPALVLGRTRHIAWGATNSHSDVTDLFIEKPDPEKPGHYLTPAGSRKAGTRQETIRVRGEPDDILTIRTTRHGPVISDAFQPPREGDEVISVQWTGSAPDDRSADAVTGLYRARNFSEAVDIMRHFRGPQQNIVLADSQGNIGLMVPGQVPLRLPASAFQGVSPAPGDEAVHDWQGIIPYDSLPRVLNPPGGQLLSANNRITGDDFPHSLGRDWEPPWRARRIGQLLDERQVHSLESFREIQADTLSLPARELLPLLTGAPAPDRRGQAALALLRAWDGTMDAERPEPLIYHAWLREIARELYAEKLGPLFPEFTDPDPAFLLRILPVPEHARLWCHDPAAPAVRNCNLVLGRALTQALARLTEHHGSDMSLWKWHRAHRARHRHIPLGLIPVIGRFFNLMLPVGGDGTTINGTAFVRPPAPGSFDALKGPGYRAIHDLANPDRSLFMISTGVSGDPLSPWYDNLAPMWPGNAYLPMSARPEDYLPGATGTLILEPSAGRPVR